jgi:hypothetical protein
VETHFVRQEKSLRYVWPSSDAETYSPVDVYSVSDGRHTAEFAVAYGSRLAFEASRRRIVVFLLHPLWPAVELVGTDSYDLDKSVVWILKKPGGNKRTAANESPHQDYAGFRTVIHRDVISKKGAFSGLAIELTEDEKEQMVRLAYIRSRHRGYFQ